MLLSLRLRHFLKRICKMSKILFFDIDGTLYDFSGHMPASTVRALRQARANGHRLVICSGRTKFQVYPELFEMFDGYIGATGAYVENKDEIIYEHFMPENIIRQAQDVIEQSGGFAVAMTRDNLIFRKECLDYLIGKFKSQGVGMDMISRIMGDYILADCLSDYRNVEKMLYYGSSWPVSKVADALRDSCDITASSFESGVDDSGEITLRNLNKSFGMKKYADYFSFRQEDTIAFGDGPNDLDMIEFAGIGVAMGNAREELKQIADMVTKSVTEDGIEYAMQSLGLIS